MKKIAIAVVLGIWSTVTLAGDYDLPGFITEIEDGRLWVFKIDSAELVEFKKHGEPAKQFTNIGAGPEGMTVKSGDQDTLDAYLLAYKNK